MLKPLLAIALTAFLSTIPAHADEGPAGNDPIDNYLYVLNSEGIVNTSDSASITAGYAVCENIARGVMPRSMENEVAKLAPKLSAYQAEVIVATAVTWLCPEYIRWYIDNR